MKTFRQLTEAKETIVFAFGRFNPPTTGHEKLIDACKKAAGSNEYRIYPSFSQKPATDPLPHSLKVAYMRKMFSKHARSIKADKSAKTAIFIAENLYKEGFKNLVMVAGSDRVKEFTELLVRYNGKPDKKGNILYDFDSVKVVSAGERDPDAEGVEGMSASKMRAAATNNEFEAFKMGVPAGFRDARKLFDDVRKHMGIREERDMGVMDSYEEMRDAYLTGKMWNIGESIETEHGTAEVVRKGTNYLSYMTEDGKVHKSWLHDIAERNYKKEYANYQGKPEQIERRSSRNKARRAMGDKAVKGMDVGHKDNNPLNNDPSNLRNEDPSKNRREPRLREGVEEIKKLEKMLKDLEKKRKKTPGDGFAKMRIKELIADLKSKKEEVDEGKKLPPHLAKFVDKKGNLKPDAAKRVQKARNKSKIKDVTPKGYGPNEELDEGITDHIPWLRKAMSTLHRLEHPTGYKKLVQMYVDGMSDEENRKRPGYWAAEIARDYKNVDARDFRDYINKLVSKGKLPKELKAEYDPLEEARMSPLARLQKFDRERGSKIFKDKGGRKKWYRMKKPGLMSIMNVPEDELKKYLKQGWQIIDEAKDYTFKDLVERININQYVAEKLPANADQGDYIKDFEKSDAPQFKGKSKEKRKEMAIAAYLAKNETKKPKIPTEKDLPSVTNFPTDPSINTKLDKQMNKGKKDLKSIKQKASKDLSQFQLKMSEQDEPEEEQGLDDLKYEKVKETPVENIDGDWKNIDIDEPPVPSSQAGKNDLDQTIVETRTRTEDEENSIKEHDMVATYAVRNYLDENDLEYDSDTITKIVEAGKGIGRYYKNKFQRIRPWDHAEAVGEEMETMEFPSDSMDTPSYPSNHSLQARMVAEFYGKKYRDHYEGLVKAADESGMGRIQAGWHYPTDHQSAVKIAETVSPMITLSEEVQEGAYGHEKQDKSIKDREGTQPAKYFKDMSKETKKKRDAHFKKKKEGPAPGDADAKTKPSVHTKKFKQMYGESEMKTFKEMYSQFDENKGLKNKSEKSGVSVGILKKVYDRGLAAYKTGHRPGTTAPQWAMARVNSFLTGGGARKSDADLWKQAKGQKEEVELDESQAEMYKLTAMAMKATPGSKAQKAIIKKLNVLRQKAGLQAIPESFDLQEQGPGLWANIHKKRKEGRPMRKKGEKGAPTTAQLKRAQGEEVSEDVELNEWGEVEEAAEYQGRKVTLNKPTRGDVKKSKVYVKNEKGNVVKVEFGDPNMEIKVDDPARRASFRARHNCENPGPKWKARYWSCKAW